MKKLRGLIRGFTEKPIITQYVVILLGVALMFSLSLFFTDRIARNAVKGDAVEQNRRNVSLVQERINKYCGDLENTASGIVNNPVLLSYMSAEYAHERIWLQRDLEKLVANTRQIKPEIVMVSLYDSSQRLVGNSGTVFIQMQLEDENAVIKYTGPLTVGDSQKYFSLQMPIFSMSGGSTSFLGTAVFLVGLTEIREFMAGAFPAEGTDSFLTGDGLLYKTGNLFAEPPEGKDIPGFLVEVRECGKPGWRLTEITSEDSLFGGINLLQKINIITYIMVFSIMLLLVILLYQGFIKPTRRLVNFMSRHSESPKERLAVHSQNEIGIISGSLNSMLDDIDFLNNQNYDAQRKYYELEIEKRKTELSAYRNQINPHFLRNTFECIRGMALLNDAQDIADITEALSRMFSYSIMGDGYATIEQELSNTREYARIIDYRFAGRHKILLSADEALLSIRIPKMLIQPLVENAVFHGLETVRINGCVWVDIVYSGENYICIKIKDNGRGMAAGERDRLRKDVENILAGTADINMNKGIGLRNICHRLHLSYGDRFLFEIESDENAGTKVCLYIPAYCAGELIKEPPAPDTELTEGGS